MNIFNLKSQFKDYARPNLFKMVFFPPTGAPIEGRKTNKSPDSLYDKIKDAINDVGMKPDKIDFAIKSATFPSTQINIIPLQRMGRTLWLPGDMEFGDLQVTFVVDTDYDIYRYFAMWMNLLNRPDSNIRGSDGNSLRGSATLYQLDGQLEKIFKFQFFHLYPKMIGDMTLDSDSENALTTLTVTFAYSYYNKFKLS